MNQLQIQVTQRAIGDNVTQTVNARELHAFLDVGKDFSTWIKDRIEQYGFAEQQDFVCSPILGSEGRGGHNRKDYHLSLDMAKELSMVERNEKGKQARAYFIECERWARNTAAAIRSATPAAIEAVHMAEAISNALRLEGSARLGIVQKAVQLNAPQHLPLVPVYAVDAPAGATAGSSEPTASLSELLRQRGVKLSAAKANQMLAELGLVERLSRPSSKTPTEKHYWALTKRGLEFGKNLSSPNNPRETQPHWFASKFAEVLALLERQAEPA